MKEPFVYICILNWNGYKDTKECLGSLEGLDYSNYKILIIDNGSTDGSVDLLKKDFGDIEILENKENLGFSGGNNAGIKYALDRGADYILVLNNDTIVSSFFLRELIKVMDDDENIGIAGPKILRYFEKNKIWFAGGKIFFPLGNTLHIGNGRKDSCKFQHVIEEDYQTGCALLVRKNVIEKTGMFDPEYTSYFEDVDFSLRCRKQGFKVCCVQKSKIWHKISSSTGGGLTSKKAYLKAKNGVKFFRKYSPRILYYTTIPLMALLYIALISLVEIAKGRGGILSGSINGILDGIKTRP